MGRPSKYETHVQPRLEEIKEWAKSGSTNKEIASALGIAVSSFCEYLNKYAEFSEAVSNSRLNGVASVKQALYKKAIGFEYEEKKTYKKKDEDGTESTYVEITKRQALPDINAIGMYLRNYDPEWLDSDKTTNDLKRMEFELRKQLAEQNNF